LREACLQAALCGWAMCGRKRNRIKRKDAGHGGYPYPASFPDAGKSSFDIL
jgi:hypothetical protein